MSTLPENAEDAQAIHGVPRGLKKIAPYWYPYTTMAKQRWLGRELLEVVSTEFRDRSMEYYRYALESGVTTINGMVAKPETIVKNGDRIENVVHRHEPPVTSTPVRILLNDAERGFIVVDKPGSIPVHASGRYFRNSLIEILHHDFGFEKCHTVNRLDRLTSGLMVIPLTTECARTVSAEFMAGTIKKEYIARCRGEFPKEEIICDEPLLTVDRQMGLNIVHPEGKHAKTVFNRLHYDADTDTSVVHCQPMTGRSHQIRVHLQFLGHPIPNDPVYSELKIWGPNYGKGGIDLTISEERAAPAPPSHLQQAASPESLTGAATPNFSESAMPTPMLTPVPADEEVSIFAAGSTTPAVAPSTAKSTAMFYPGEGAVTLPAGEQAAASGQDAPKLLPRETGHDIGMGSPVPLSAEAVGIITRLRNMKDEDEDWGRWRDVVFRAKGALTPRGVKIKPPPAQNRRKRGGAVFMDDKSTDRLEDAAASMTLDPGSQTTVAFEAYPPKGTTFTEPSMSEEFTVPTPTTQLTTEEAIEKAAATLSMPGDAQDPATYCSECYMPLHPDPKPERLYIFLHAMRYTTSLGCFATEMPAWAAEGWEWDRS